MRYCSNCGSEYVEDATECSDCPGARLVSSEELRALGVPRSTEFDQRRFVRLAHVEDALTAQLLTRRLEEAGIPVLSTDPRGGTVDTLTTGISQDWWELRVQRSKLEAAQQLLADERELLRERRDDADLERLAEQEALSSPPPTPH